jgi:hypothetical protein
MGLGQARLGRQNPIVDLTAPARSAREDPQPLQLLFVRELGGCLAVQDLDGGDAVLVVRDAFALAEDEHGRVRFRLELDLGREAHAEQRRAHDVPEPFLGQQEIVLLATLHDDQRSDHPGLRRQQQRGARRLLDVVRDHSLEEILRIRSADGNVLARSKRRCGRNDLHRN